VLPDLPRQIDALVVDPAGAGTVRLATSGVGAAVSRDGGASWESLGKPGGDRYIIPSALAVSFGPQPLLVVGVEDNGAWRYSGYLP
jgi:hypothetical protein